MSVPTDLSKSKDTDVLMSIWFDVMLCKNVNIFENI